MTDEEDDAYEALKREIANPPRTLEDAVQRLLAEISADHTKALLFDCEDVGMLIARTRGSWGNKIRMTWIAPPGGNPELIESCGVAESRAVPGVIMESVWNRLQNRALVKERETAPKTIEDAVSRLASIFPEKDKEGMRKIDTAEVAISYLSRNEANRHKTLVAQTGPPSRNWSIWIRDAWTTDNPELVKACGADSDEDAAVAILGMVWKNLREGDGKATRES